MKEGKEMSFLEHVGELRWHLIRSLVAVAVGAVLVGFNINWVMDNIFFGPTKPDFPTFKWINSFSMHFFGQKPFDLPEKFPIIVRKLYEQFNVMMAVSFFGGLVIAFPYVVWEMWRFISPAMRINERKNSVFIINGVWFLFILGVLCGYFLILPFAINFGYFFQISDSISPYYDLSDYIALFLQITLGMGVVFLLPMLVYMLTMMEIITPKFLRTYRRHATVVILVIAAVITPADVLSMMIAALPLLLLYEISIFISAAASRKINSVKH